MKNRYPLFILLSLMLLLFVVCGEDENNITNNTPVHIDRPIIPEPTYYAGPVPDKSLELIVKTVELSNFTPSIDSAYPVGCCEGCDFKCRFYSVTPDANRLSLVKDKTIETEFNSLGIDVSIGLYGTTLMYCNPLSSKPYLQHVRYWRRLGTIERYSGSTSVTVTRSVTRGVERTEAEEFGTSIGIETSASGGFFVEFSVTLKAEFSYSSSVELSVSEEETVEESFTISCPDNQNIVYCVWQLVDEYRIIGVDGLQFADLNYCFCADALTAVVPSSEYVPMTNYFNNK